jgi:acylphosphatase
VIRRRVVIHGRVQGVFFRDSVRRLAERNGVAGWVRNNRDGSVEAAFEGDDEDVARLVDYCRSGPSGALVESVDVYEETPEGAAGFSIR